MAPMWQREPMRDSVGASVTVKTVAAHSGLSSQTVSRVVRCSGYVSESARAMVLKSIEAVGYRPSAVGRSLRAARTPMIGLVITDIANPFYARIHKAVEATFRDHGLTVMLLNSDDNRAVERQQLDLLSSYSPSGLLLAPAVESTLTDRDLAQFGNCVLISRTLPKLAVPSVVTNELEAAEEATRALIGAGHRRILAVLGPASASTTRARESGYRAAMHVIDQEALICYTDQTTTGTRAAIKAVIHAHPDATAAVAFNVSVTEGILAGLQDLGLQCPADLSLVAFTDAGWLESFQPPITVVSQPVEAMGELAAQLVLDLLDGKSVDPGLHIVPSRLLHRSSIVAPRPRTSPLSAISEKG